MLLGHHYSRFTADEFINEEVNCGNSLLIPKRRNRVEGTTVGIFVGDKSRSKQVPCP